MQALFTKLSVFFPARLVAAAIGETEPICRRQGKWKNREKNGRGVLHSPVENRGKRGRMFAVSRCVDYLAMVQSTPSDLYFRKRPAKAYRPSGRDKFGRSGTTISSQTRQCQPRCFVTTGCDCRAIKVDSLQMDWKAPAGGSPASPLNGMRICRDALLSLSLSHALFFPLLTPICIARAMDP